MIAMRTKLLVGAVVLVGAFAYLAFAGMQSGWVYFVGVEQYVNDSQFHSQRVRLHGKVAADGLNTRKALMTASFNLAGGDASLPVVYRGTIPDLFEAGRDVVVEGRRDAAGVFQADVLMTKCASKYEAGTPHGKNGNKSEVEKRT
jgi:cytochrome c-type biogenesis protein CcmE